MDEHHQWEIVPALRVNCKDCTAECCKHIALQLDAPTTQQDFEQFLYLCRHPDVIVYLDDEGDWLAEFLTRCAKLQGNRCSAWGTPRFPMICGEYSMDTCVMNVDGDYGVVRCVTPEDVIAFALTKGFTISGDTTPLRTVRVPIETPTEWRDFDDIRWYIAHTNVRVCAEGDAWYVELGDPVSPHVVFATWEDVDAYLQAHGITKPLQAELRVLPS